MQPEACRMSRRRFVQRLAWVGSTAALLPLLAAEDKTDNAWRFEPGRDLIPAPSDPAEWGTFREKLAEWRARTRRELGYSDAQYQRPEFAWTQRCFACAFLMLCDETVYDASAERWQVEKFVSQGEQEFGGYDAVVLWHAYPRIGLDDRNQFDFYRDQPGGLAGLRKVATEFQARGVRVFLNYNPWDTGTRREPEADLQALCRLVGALGADGIFLDTMDQGAADFRSRLDAVRPGVALESEIALPLGRIHDHHLSWAQWFPDSEAPGVLRNKFFERRHLQHQIKRWDHDHSSELHAAWMNGSGIMIWENVFGSWVGWSERDKSILRSMLPIQRRFAALFCGESWTPLVPTCHQRLYASLWETDGVRLWTLVNRSEEAIEGDLLPGENARGDRVYDLVAGTEFADGAGPAGVLRGRVAPRGIGCILAATDRALATSQADLLKFLESQQATARRAVWDPRSPGRVTRLRPAPRTPRKEPGPDMVTLPTANLVLRIEMRDRECGHYESSPAAGHRLAASYNFRVSVFERPVRLETFLMDLTPVTNAQYQEFLKATGYRPQHPENFLKHWVNGTPPHGREDHPVVYVDLDDARSYARWRGKRLPSEEEWQYAAAGSEGRRYPWGDEMLPGRCNGGETGGTTPVTQFPSGRSPFGIYDLCGNVWEWTESERTDGRTRFSIVRGGSYFTARGSGWYMDGGPRPNSFAAKMLLMWPGLDRCATVGFRCAADVSA